MTSFKDRPFGARFGQMGDQAEAVFEEVADRGIVRFGLKRPPIKVGDLPARLRHLPDYLQSRRFVEVQGVGTDQLIKIKLEKWDCIRFWNTLHPVDLFVYDSKHDRYEARTMAEVTTLLDAHGEMGHFHEGRAYLAIPASEFFDV